MGNKSDVFLGICSITNVSFVWIYIGGTMAYPTQFSMSGKLNKERLRIPHFSLHDEIKFHWSATEFKYQDETILFLSSIQVLCMGNLKLENQ